MNHYIEIWRGVANDLKAADVPFLVYGLPVITVLGEASLLYLGLLGILKKHTYVLLRRGTTRSAQIQGWPAVLVGIIYLFTFLILLVILLPLSLSLLGLL